MTQSNLKTVPEEVKKNIKWLIYGVDKSLCEIRLYMNSQSVCDLTPSTRGSQRSNDFLNIVAYRPYLIYPRHR